MLKTESTFTLCEKYRSSCHEVFCKKKVLLKSFQNTQKNTRVQNLFFNNIAGGRFYYSFIRFLLQILLDPEPQLSMLLAFSRFSGLKVDYRLLVSLTK